MDCGEGRADAAPPAPDTSAPAATAGTPRRPRPGWPPPARRSRLRRPRPRGPRPRGPRRARGIRGICGGTAATRRTSRPGPTRSLSLFPPPPLALFTPPRMLSPLQFALARLTLICLCLTACLYVCLSPDYRFLPLPLRPTRPVTSLLPSPRIPPPPTPPPPPLSPCRALP